jgi:DNA-binding Lrp family transcriptional regulator
LEKVTINPTEMKVLKYLYQNNEGSNQEELTKRLKLTIGTVSKALDKLNSKGIIYCIKHPINIYRLIPELKKDAEVILTGYDFGKNKKLIIDAHYFVFQAEIITLTKKNLSNYRRQTKTHQLNL